MVFFIPAMKLLFWPIMHSLELIMSGLLAEDIDLSIVLVSSLFLQRRHTPFDTRPSIFCCHEEGRFVDERHKSSEELYKIIFKCDADAAISICL